MNRSDITDLPPRDRMRAFLGGCLASDKTTPAQLAKKLGYANDRIVQQWLTGTTKVPLQQLSSISDKVNCDLSDLLAVWLAQELPDDLHMLSTARRIVGAWEFLLIDAAREIYGVEEA